MTLHYLEGKDVFPTATQICYYILPVLFDIISHSQNKNCYPKCIVIVVSP